MTLESVNDAASTAIEAFTVEELAKRAGVPVRTVRYYQTRRLLPVPDRVGREARYDDRHLDRLRLIAELQDRGLRLSAIVDLLPNGGDAHTSLPAWLGLGETLEAPWTEDRPELLTEAELLHRLGDDGTALRDGLIDTGVLERRSDTTPVTYLLTSPALLDIALELRAAGFDLETAAASRRLLQQRLGRLADELVAEVTERVSLDRLAEGGPAELAALIDVVRPVARRAVDVVFAHEMERALRSVTDPGGRAVPTRRRSRAR
ncbi:hypothetical protein BH20ACT2_BH20ACT2_20210 [soil metagenome]